MLKLFYAPGSCALASHIALEEAQARFELQRLDLKAGDQTDADYLKVNPKGRVPALQTDKGVLTESPVILGYIAQTFPDARLADNDDSFAFGNMQAFNMWLSSHVHIAFAHMFRPARYAADEACAGSMRETALETLGKAFAEIDARLAADGPWVHGGAYTVSDPYVFVFERWWLSGDAGRAQAFAHVKDHHDRVAARPAVRRALEAEGLS